MYKPAKNAVSVSNILKGNFKKPRFSGRFKHGFCFQLKIRENLDYYTIQRITGENIDQVPYKSKSIVIDFINRKNNKIIWRGTTDKVEIDNRRTARDVRKYVDEIFKQFP